MHNAQHAPVREKLLSAVGNGRPRLTHPQVRPCELPNPVAKQGLKTEDLQYRVEDESTSSQAWVPLRVISPERQEGRRPTVLFLHPTGSSMASEQNKQIEYALRGYVTAAIDCRYHGQRCKGAEDPRLAYNLALVRAWRDGRERPFLLDNVWDIMHGIDYLLSREDVGRIGLTGVSLGGMHAWLAAAADERVHASAPIIGVQGFKWAVDNNAWQGRAESIPHVFQAAAEDLGHKEVNSETVQAVWTRITPGLLSDYDAPQSLPAIAPRPFLVANGGADPRCPLPGVAAAFAAAQNAYQEALLAQGMTKDGAQKEADNRLRLYVEKDVGHKPTEGMHAAVRDFFEQHLRA